MAQILAPAIGQRNTLVVVAVAALALLYLVGLDQGQLLSLVQGNIAFNQNLLHEIVHDVRHAAALPCH